MSMGFWQIVVIALLGVLLFGRGRISDLMGEVARGIKSFKKGMSDDSDDSIFNDKNNHHNTNKHLPHNEKDLTDITPHREHDKKSEH